MKKILSVSLVLVLLLGILTGCSLEELIPEKTVTCDDLTITVPGLFVDLKSTVNNDALSFLYGFNDTAVMGIQESIAKIQAVSPETTTAKAYAELFLQANNLQAEVAEKDGLVTFTYTSTVDSNSFTYVCAAFVNSTNFWVIQAYCYTENFQENEAELWACLQSVKV